MAVIARLSFPVITWTISLVIKPNNVSIWSTDGNPVVNFPRGVDINVNVSSVSSRFAVQSQGFLDVTTVFENTTNTTIVDFNGAMTCVANGTLLTGQPFSFELGLPGNGIFSISPSPSTRNIRCAPSSILSTLKPLPAILPSDISLFRHMISTRIVPYGANHIPDAPGKPFSLIRDLGNQFLPWTVDSFELAMSIYDWTTASFARVVFMKVFEYTSLLNADGGHPLDVASIAEMIYASNWSTYTPTNATYMSSFLLGPASTLANVTAQLSQNNNSILRTLHAFSLAQNRLISAALASLPRITVFAKPLLFSGQVDISQFGTSRFGIEFLEWAGNAGPVNKQMGVDLTTALSSFVSPGKTITTKMVWSFTDSVEDAAHYSNGILLIAEPPEGNEDGVNSFVWDTTTFITPLSDDPAKTEYIFPPGSKFRVKSVEPSVVDGNTLQVIHLEVLGTRSNTKQMSGLSKRSTKDYTPVDRVDFARLRGIVLSSAPEPRLSQALASLRETLDSQLDAGRYLDHVKEGKTNGRWCRCLQRNALAL